jgi:hypothetical protein
MRQTGHRSLAMVRRYIRDGSLSRSPGGEVAAFALLEDAWSPSMAAPELNACGEF